MELMLDFPIVSLVRFFKNHGFLGLNTQHQWWTLEGGSESYKKILIAPFRDRIHVGKGVQAVTRTGNGVQLRTANGELLNFDKVIIAAHGDEALKMLEQPSSEEHRLLSCFKYQQNIAAVHTDDSVMPKTKSTWSSWNYRIEERNASPNGEGGRSVQVPTTIYWMNSLQGVSKKRNYFVSINPIEGSIDPKKLIRSINYTHPLFDVPAMNAQSELNKLNESGPVYFCGSYFRYGFHEDAYMSAVELCSKL